jgi:hypothetical protein
MQMNELLIAPFKAEEVKCALFDIGDLKAPSLESPSSLDGLHVVFYKRFWHLLEDDLIHEVLAAVNSCTIPEGWR